MSSPHDEDTVPPRLRARRETRPLLRAAVLVCPAGAESRPDLARLREIAAEREIYVEVASLQADDASRPIWARPGAVFVASAAEPRALVDPLVHACATLGSALLVLDTHDEDAIRASVAAIEETIILRVGSGLHDGIDG